MFWIVLIAAYLIIALCLTVVLAPKLLRKTIDFFSIGSRLYLVGIFRLALGVMLLVLARHTKFWGWGYVVTVGLLLSASGISLFFFALRRTKKLLTRLQQQSNLTLRLYAIIALVLWGLLIYALLPATSR